MTIWKNKSLAKRFVNDCKLPIPIISEELFNYHLDLYQDLYHSRYKWDSLVKLIDEKFDGDSNSFLEEYYKVRDNIITDTLSNKAFIAFNTMSLKDYDISNKESIPSNNIYNQDNNGKVFISIDIEKANFQTLRKVNKDIVLNADTYEDFVGNFTDIEYIKESKYTRQCIFGKLNPSRHIKIEKYFTYQIYENLKTYSEKYGWKVVSLSNDEIVYEVGNIFCDSYTIGKFIKDTLDITVHVNFYRLDAYQVYSNKDGNNKFVFYIKTDMVNSKRTLVTVPLQFHSIIYKLTNDIEVCQNDYHFSYEGIDCMFCDDFGIKKIELR